MPTPVNHLPESTPLPADTETMKTFMGMLAHEMRTQVAGICTASTILLEERGSGKRLQQYLSHIKYSGEDLLHVLDNMMATATVGNGNLDITLKDTRVQLREWLKLHLRQYNLITAVRDIKLKTVVHRSVPEYITTDVIKLGQVLKNLIDNAIKHSPPNSYISITIHPLGDNRLLFQVTDQGVGIPEDKIHLLFQPFRQLDNGLAGTGLGLYISKLYATSLGGDVMIGSNHNSGTTFLLLITHKTDA
ncbi:HAMP domain-containing histidine kinase [Chitinophaga horti]|uniref:histidine kinase n=1 Tax=Chitinophaga horti TaxID=2920382 RepID=A0ABY6IZL9_9BACT|nr:HAMP domain-containing sensor histidine kinase [Chitinophaga horti]UYQ92832.1 HAMP domain-containing histidine kinase [Chitinophaga horti]